MEKMEWWRKTKEKIAVLLQKLNWHKIGIVVCSIVAIFSLFLLLSKQFRFAVTYFVAILLYKSLNPEHWDRMLQAQAIRWLILSLTFLCVMCKNFVLQRVCPLKKYSTLSALSLLYIFLPIAIFVLGWLKIALALPIIVALIASYIFMAKDICIKEETTKIAGSRSYWIAVSLVAFFWVLYSGIGTFSAQNWDFFLRNPIYRDLVNYKWPVYFDLSKQNEAVRNLAGTDVVAFSYYFFFWLPPALLSKVLCCSEPMANLFLLLWEYAGIMLVIVEMHKYLKKASWFIIAGFILFSGLDVVGCLLFNGRNAITSTLGDGHLEWWSGMQFSSNTTLLYWVFNQAVPVWLIVMLILNGKKSSNIALCAMTFPYSAFVTVGIIPVAIYIVFRKDSHFKKVFSFQNIFISFLMLIMIGTFYKSNSSNVTKLGLLFWNQNLADFFRRYIIFMILEIGLYVAILWKERKTYDYLVISTITLILIYLTSFAGGLNYNMRACISELFIINIYAIRFVLETKRKVAKTAMLIILLLGSFTAFNEISRNILCTKDKVSPQEFLYSLGNMQVTDPYYINMCNAEVFTHNPEKTFFFKYLCKGRRD